VTVRDNIYLRGSGAAGERYHKFIQWSLLVPYARSVLRDQLPSLNFWWPSAQHHCTHYYGLPAMLEPLSGAPSCAPSHPMAMLGPPGDPPGGPPGDPPGDPPPSGPGGPGDAPVEDEDDPSMHSLVVARNWIAQQRRGGADIDEDAADACR
jgi:hypothetical protein